MRMEIDAILFSASAGEMSYYFSHLDQIEVLSMDNKLEYFLGFHENKKIILTHTGLGKVQAAAVFNTSYQYFAPKMAVFTGLAGAVDRSLEIGDLIIGKKCIDADLLGIHEALVNTPFEDFLQHRHEAGEIPKEYFADDRLVKLAMGNLDYFTRSGCLASSDNFPSPSEKIKMLRIMGVSSMDMESACFYHMAEIFKIPALAIRAISNKLDLFGEDDDLEDADLKGAEKAAEIALDVVENFFIK